MAADPFDAFATLLTSHVTRRRTLGLLGLMGVAGTGLVEDAEAGKNKRNRKNRCSRREKAIGYLLCFNGVTNPVSRGRR